ncbi:hypothetical protein BFS06_11610 [Clostridium perfringens]|uniref:Uncharacterized protein n=1 Tax=Clostridium perfringens TaxID=1502 RepID=A0A140GS30_CLOPF|nr:hypothetical protein [Clostridium perfringens]AMN31339.1 hypothetical protein JFP838_pA0423 [Clostridium perfringens]TBX14860.1 hypothetical protein BFS06_11610 [Clostridium perfringens]
MEINKNGIRIDNRKKETFKSLPKGRMFNIITENGAFLPDSVVKAKYGFCRSFRELKAMLREFGEIDIISNGININLSSKEYYDAEYSKRLDDC